MTMITYPRGITSLVRCKSCNAPTDGFGRCIAADCGREPSNPRVTWALAAAAALTIGWFAVGAGSATDDGARKMWLKTADSTQCLYVAAMPGGEACQDAGDLQ